MRGARSAEMLDPLYRHDYRSDVIQYDNRPLRQAAFTELATPEMSPMHIRQHPSNSYLLPPAPKASSRLLDET